MCDTKGSVALRPPPRSCSAAVAFVLGSFCLVVACSCVSEALRQEVLELQKTLGSMAPSDEAPPDCCPTSCCSKETNSPLLVGARSVTARPMPIPPQLQA
eukprot:2784227-Amphidinium_carterae.1